MSYEPTIWKKGDKVTSTKLNKIENGIQGNDEEITSIKEDLNDVNEELADVRVGADGTTYDSAGAAVRGQITDLKSKSNNYDKFIIGLDDLVGDISYTKNYYLNDSGIATAMNGFYYTSFIPVDSLTKYSLIVNAGDSTNPLRIHGYNSSGNWEGMVLKQPIGGGGSAKDITLTFNIPSNITQIRISSYGNKVLKAMLPQGIKNIVKQLNITIDDIDFSNPINGFIKSTGATVISGNWKHVTIPNVKKGTVIRASVYGLASLDAIMMFDKIGNYAYGITPSAYGTATHELVAIIDGTVHINFSSSYGASGSVIYSSVFDERETASSMYLAMLHKIGVIGDSLASGEIWNGSAGRDCYNYSWLSNIARDVNADCVHYSKGGMTAKTWWNDDGGYKTALANESTKPSAYYIALGTNDKNQSEYPIGNITDAAGTDSFVGYMRSIVEYVHTQQPNAVIFLVSTYNTSSASTPYNEMIEDISDLYSYCFFIDYANNGVIQTTQSSIYVENSHFSTLGYVEVANAIKGLTEDQIQNNFGWFKHFGLNNYNI